VSEGAPLPELLDHVFRRHYGRMVAGLTRVFGADNIDLAEDVVQDALLRALKTWPYGGMPDDPEAWLVRVAQNAGRDALRRRSMMREKLDELERWAASYAEAAEPSRSSLVTIADDSLRMMFLCCHPRLTPESQVALTLKTLCGLGVREIAAALLSKPATVAQRLTRAKALLQRERVAFELPPPDQLGTRTESVLDVIYLMFNEGYRAHEGAELVRKDLVEEAVRLAGLMLEVPQAHQPQVHALIALMCFIGGRLPARTDAAGEPLTLALQDRDLWDRRWIACGFHHFERSIGGARVTRFHAEAVIASYHAAAPTYADTDWRQILERYDDLLARYDSPLARLNRAVAVAKVHGIAAALAELDELGNCHELRDYSLLPATRAQLHWSGDDREAAIANYLAALRMRCSAPERAFLERRLRSCRDGEPAPAF
jgi:RNA polymerase sigma-70 factor (ECF subfamily)